MVLHILLTNEPDLAVVQCLEAQVDVLAAPPVEPHLGLLLIHIRNAAVLFPVIYIGSIGEEHFFIAEVPAGVFFTEGLTDEPGDLKITEAGVSGLKNAGFQNDIRIFFVKRGDGVTDGSVVVLLTAVGDPGYIGSAYILNAAGADHIQTTAAIGWVVKMHGTEEPQGHGAGEIIAKNLFGDPAVEGKIQAGVCRMLLHGHRQYLQSVS